MIVLSRIRGALQLKVFDFRRAGDVSPPVLMFYGAATVRERFQRSRSLTVAAQIENRETDVPRSPKH